MRFDRKKRTIGKLKTVIDRGTLIRNEEYQRGATWTPAQKQGLIDSIFREYPIPPIFLLKNTTSGGFEDETSTSYEIVDGQQRLNAISEFLKDNFPTLRREDAKLRLPFSIRNLPAPWAGATFTKIKEADGILAKRFEETEIDVFEILEASPDEVRDLFIRLQAGTALNRQQVRDAWPGKVGELVVRLAGKLKRQPSIDLFRLIDARGGGLAEEAAHETKDKYVGDRQTCAQLLRLFVIRDRDRNQRPSVGPNELDELYRTETELGDGSADAQKFKKCLSVTESVLKRVTKKTARNKVLKMQLFAVFQYVHDTQDLPIARWTVETETRVAKSIARFQDKAETLGLKGKSTSGERISEYYLAWRDFLGTEGVVPLDGERLFSPAQKRKIYARARGKCQECGKAVKEGEAEYDHIRPWTLGGPTSEENGRLLHARCHKRGLAAIRSDTSVSEDDE